MTEERFIEIVIGFSSMVLVGVAFAVMTNLASRIGKINDEQESEINSSKEKAE